MRDPDARRRRWNERYAARALVWSAGPNQRLEREVRGMTPKRALDAACGEGRNALWLAEQGWTVTGVDFSEVAIDKARQIARKRDLAVDWQVVDLASESPTGGPWDLVCVLYLHTDAPERARWLPRLVDAVAPGGTFLYIGHDPSNIEHGVGGPENPEYLPDAAAIGAALPGFRIESASVLERPVSADPGHGGEPGGVALDTLVRAVRPVR